MKKVIVVLLALLALGAYLGDQEPVDPYPEMEKLWHETNGQYGWPPRSEQ